MTAQRIILIVLIVSVLTIAGAWAFELAGYAPCPLCLKQRWPWYGAIALCLALLVLPAQRRWGLPLLALLMLGSGAFGAYHAGIEWGFWPGPGTCEGALSGGLPSLGNDPVVGCDEAALRILGVSLAGWNAVISLALALLAVLALRRP